MVMTAGDEDADNTQCICIASDAGLGACEVAMGTAEECASH